MTVRKKKIKKVRKTKKPKLVSIPKLERALWNLFSIAVRVKWVDKDGYCTCVTCSRKIYYYGGACHAGHFRPRTAKTTKYAFNNVHPQCATCNTFSDGEQYIHGKWIDNEYGEGTADEITYLSKKTIKDVGMNMREFIPIKEEECIDIIREYGMGLSEWQERLTKKLLKRITDGL